MNIMKKKMEYYFCVIMSIICFSLTGSLLCVAAENSAGTEESTKVSDTLESVDIRLEEMADKVDLEDASSVASYIRELYRMMDILSKMSRENDAEKELEERFVRLPSYVGENSFLWKTGDGRGGAFRTYGGDNYSTYFILDGELIGIQTGHSDGTIDFASQLPQWKDDDTSMDVPLVGDDPMRRYQDKKISREDVLQMYGDIIKEIWPD